MGDLRALLLLPRELKRIRPADINLLLSVFFPSQDQSLQQETASALPDGRLRAALQETDEAHRDRGRGRKGQRSHTGERGGGPGPNHMEPYALTGTGSDQLRLGGWSPELLGGRLAAARRLPPPQVCHQLLPVFPPRVTSRCVESVRVLAVDSGSVEFTREFVGL